MKPSVSVIMPVYNAERYLREAVDSILGQTFGDFEFIIVNDGSTDGSEAILRDYALRDLRILLKSRPNTGYTRALNEALAMARGEFIARMDADDISEASRLAVQIAFLRDNHDLIAVGSRVLLIDTEGDPICQMNFASTHLEIESVHLGGFSGSAICHPSVMIKAEELRAAGGYRVDFEPAEDLDLFLRLAERGRLANLQTPLLRYRQHPSSVGHRRCVQQRAAATRALNDALVRRGIIRRTTQPAASPDTIPDMEAAHRKWAWWALQAGNLQTARKHAIRTVRLAPLSLLSWKVMCCAIRGY